MITSSALPYINNHIGQVCGTFISGVIYTKLQLLASSRPILHVAPTQGGGDKSREGWSALPIKRPILSFFKPSFLSPPSFSPC